MKASELVTQCMLFGEETTYSEIKAKQNKTKKASHI
jgi:hypothetical protein